MYSKQRRELSYKNITYFNKLKGINYGIPLCLLMLGMTGLLMLFSISGGEINQTVINHMIRLFVGFIFFIFFSLISFRILRVISFPLYFIIILMLIWLYVFEASTVSRWINLGGTSFQPSEFLKFILILTLSSYYSFFGANKSKKLRFNILPIILIVIPSFLILNQPDLGTAVLIFIMGFSAVFFSGLYLKWVVFGSSIVFISIPVVIANLKPYQMKRLEVFFDPDKDPFGSGYHIIQSKIAIGSGGLNGNGFLEGSQSSLDFLPEKETDFVFAIFSEQFGFTGSIILISIFLIFFLIPILKTFKLTQVFNKIILFVLSFKIFFEFLINISMTIGLLPVVGVALPFMSYGGSSLLSNMIICALLMNLMSVEEKKRMFS